MSTQSSMQMDEQARSATRDLRTIVASRKSPGIVILNGLGEMMHLNDTAWTLLSLIRQHAPVSTNGLVPEVIMDLCHELDSKIVGRGAAPPHARLETTTLVMTVDGGVLLRALALEGTNDLPSQGRRFLVMLEQVAEREVVNASGRERFGLTDREWEVAQVLTQGLTNKEIGNALGITEPTVKAHIKHIMEKMKCTTRTAIVSCLAGSLARGSA